MLGVNPETLLTSLNTMNKSNVLKSGFSSNKEEEE